MKIINVSTKKSAEIAGNIHNLKLNYLCLHILYRHHLQQTQTEADTYKVLKYGRL